MKAAREFLDAIQSGKQKVEKEPSEIFAVRHLPSRQFIIQQLHHLKDVWNGSVRLHYFAGRDASGWWWLETGGKRGTDSPDGVFSINDTEMPILPTYYKLSTELFRLGMYDLDTDTILIDEFRKKHFAKKGEIPFQAMRRKDFGSGKLSGTAFAVNNRIERISYQHEPKGGVTISGREIELRYLNNQLFLVRVFNRVKHRNETKMTHYADYKVLQYTPAKDPHPKGYCSAEQFMADSDFDILHSKDGEMYNIKRDPNNPIEPSPSPFAYYGEQWLVFGMMILVCGAFWFLHVRSKKNPNNK